SPRSRRRRRRRPRSLRTAAGRRASAGPASRRRTGRWNRARSCQAPPRRPAPRTRARLSGSPIARRSNDRPCRRRGARSRAKRSRAPATAASSPSATSIPQRYECTLRNAPRRGSGANRSGRWSTKQPTPSSRGPRSTRTTTGAGSPSQRTAGSTNCGIANGLDHGAAQPSPLHRASSSASRSCSGPQRTSTSFNALLFSGSPPGGTPNAAAAGHRACATRVDWSTLGGMDQTPLPPGFAPADSAARPLHILQRARLDPWLQAQPGPVRAWLSQQAFDAAPGSCALLPGEDGVAGAVIGIGDPLDPYAYAHAPTALPEGDWRPAGSVDADAARALQLGWGLGAYRFTRYKAGGRAPARLARALDGEAGDLLAACVRVRDLVNTPSQDMGPDQLQAVVEAVAGRHGAR